MAIDLKLKTDSEGAKRLSLILVLLPMVIAIVGLTFSLLTTYSASTPVSAGEVIYNASIFLAVAGGLGGLVVWTILQTLFWVIGGYRRDRSTRLANRNRS